MANSQLLEILLLAMVAGVILFRLYTVLGRRTGHEPTQEPFRLNNATDNTAEAPQIAALPVPRSADLSADPLTRGLQDIRTADRSFDADHFLNGARHAYELVLTAYSANDRAALKPLLSDEVYAAFDVAMKGREQRNEKTSFTFVGFKDTKITQASLHGKMADVTVAFTAQFISATTDASGAVVDGDPKSVCEVTDIWSFERNVRASDPNWTLIHTSGAEPSA